MTHGAEIPKLAVNGTEELKRLVGVVLAPSPWQAVHRKRIVQFDKATVHQPSTNYPGGEESTAAHGTHSLALLMSQWDSTVAVSGFRTVVVYGFDRVRFPAPLRVGCRVRARFVVVEVVELATGAQLTIRATLECETEPKPACVAEVVIRLVW